MTAAPSGGGAVPSAAPRLASAGAPIGLSFNGVRYSTYVWSLQQPLPRRKEILHGVSGEFGAGQLTAIIGPSGAGKTTLLDVLALYKSRGVEGEVLRAHARRSRVAYIQQDDRLRAALTPLEALVLAARLKLGCGHRDASQQALSLLETLGLTEQGNTLTRHLSGGQRKRLAVALELVGDPALVFLDEPTTGLDSSSCTQCLRLLKLLAQQGRTVVCTIHQPSALLFHMFDHVYALADGHCVYEGAPTHLLPFLVSCGLRCPPYHNPADFLIDVSVGEYDVLVAATSIKRDNESATNIISNGDVELQRLDCGLTDVKIKKLHKEEKSPNGASVFLQYYLLYKRNLTCKFRDYSNLLIRILAHLSIALIFGYIYKNCGNSADLTLANYIFLYGTTLFLMYTGKMAVTLHFPLELKIIKNEHFNHWYSLPVYFFSLLSVEIPVQIVCNCIYLSISYYLTSQPVEAYRIVMFFIYANIASLIAQGSGFIIGCLTPIKIAVFLGPAILILVSMFGFNIFHRDIPSALEFMFHISYFRAAFHGLVTVTYGEGRKELPCPQDITYCHFKYPQKFLQEVDVLDVDLMANLYMLLGVTAFVYILGFMSIWLRLKVR